MSDKMTTAETSAWLVGQYQLALALADDLKRGYDIDARLNQYLKTIGEEARKNNQMALLFSTIDLRREIVENFKNQNA